MKQKIKNYLKKKRAQSFTFMVVPNSGGITRSLNIPLFTALLFIILLGVNIYFLARYPWRISEIVQLDTRITQLNDIIARQERDLKRIDPSIKKTQEIEEQINANNKMATEIQESFAAILNQTKGRKTVSRSRSYQPIRLPEYKLSSADNDLTKLEMLNENLEVLEKEIIRSEEQLSSLLSELGDFNRELDHMPTIWPVYGRITSGYGWRMHPIQKQRKFHDGIDISALSGTRVRATGAGTVSFSGYKSGYGWTVEINHGYGYKTRYAHNSRLLVSVGQNIRKGQTIAYSGNSGVSTAPHLHYGVIKNGKSENPINYLWQ